MDAFRALAAPRRRQVVELLARRGRLSASQISAEFDVTPQAISQHLRILREADLLRMEKRAQQRLYTFNPRPLGRIQAWTLALTDSWTRRLDRLEKALQEQAP